MSGTFAFHNIYTTKNDVENIQTVLHEGNESGEGTMRRFEFSVKHPEQLLCKLILFFCR